MCLIRSKNSEHRLRQRFSKTRRITAYKAMIFRNGLVESPWYARCHVWRPGWNVSDRRSVEAECSEQDDVTKGIHVYLRKTDARKQSPLVLPVQCKCSDLVGAGYDATTGDQSAVFHKVFVKKADWQEAETFND